MGELNPDQLRNDLINTVFGTGTAAVLRGEISEDGKVDIAAIKANLERDIFEVLAKYNISRDKAAPAVGNFMQNLNRLK